MAGQTVTVSVLADTKKFSRAMKNLGDETGLTKLAAGAKKAGLALAAMAAAAAVAVGAIAAKLIQAGEAAATSNARIGNIAEKMQLFGNNAKGVTDRLVKLAEATARNTGIDQNAIKATQAKLLTFKEIAATADNVGGSFDRATQAAIDLQAAGFGSAEESAVQLGKALNDPIKGISALTRVGLTFTEAEKEQIAAMQAAGDMAGAQSLVLAAIETQVAGTAEATANASDKMKVGFSQLQERLGQKLLPAFEKVTAFFLEKGLPTIERLGDRVIAYVVPALKQFSEWFTSQGLPALQEFAGWLGREVVPRVVTLATWVKGTLVPALVNMGKWLVKNRDWLAALAITVGILYVGIKAYVAALKIWKAITLVATAAQTVFNAVMVANPIGLIVLAIAALVAGLVFFFTQTETGKKAWASLTEAFQKGWAWIQDAFQNGVEFVQLWLGKALAFIKTVWSFSPLGLVVTNWDRIEGAFNAGVSFVQNLLGRAKDAIVKVWSFSPLGLIVTNWDKIAEFFTSLPDRIRAALGNVGDTLRNAGKQLIDGFLGGITSKFNSVKRTLGNLTSKLTSWKGPPARDAKLLTDNGQLVLQSFIDGLESKFKTARRSLGGFTTSLAGSATSLAPKTSLAGMTGTTGAGIIINITTGVGDPVAIGREISAALAAFERTNGGRRA